SYTKTYIFLAKAAILSLYCMAYHCGIHLKACAKGRGEGATFPKNPILRLLSAADPPIAGGRRRFSGGLQQSKPPACKRPTFMEDQNEHRCRYCTTPDRIGAGDRHRAGALWHARKLDQSVG